MPSESVVFTNDVQDLTWTPSGSSSVVSASYDGNTLFEITVYPDKSGECRLVLADLLRSVIPHLPALAEDAYGITPIAIIVDGQAYQYYAFQGSAAGESADTFMSRPLFVGRQISNTYSWAKELLCYFAAAGDLGYTVRAYLTDGSTVTEALQVGKIDPVVSPLYLMVIDVSPEHVALLFDVDVKDIVAYDVYRDASAVKRFMISSSGSLSTREFLFRNEFGVLQSVFSLGEITEGLEHETVTFITGRITQELINTSRKTISVDCGYVADSELRLQWLSFLRSSERYEYLPGGRATRRIIVDEADASLALLELGTLSFKYHYSDSEKLEGATSAYKELMPYNAAQLFESGGRPLADNLGRNLLSTENNANN